MADYKANLILQLKDFASKGIGGVATKLAVLRQGFLAVKDTVVAVAQVGFDLVKSYGIQERAVEKLNEQLKNTGEFSAETSQKLQRIASDIQRVTTVGDETTIQLMQLASSMGVTSDKLGEAAKQAIGMSKAFGVDLQAAIKMVALAHQGEYTLLNRYIPQLRSLNSTAEKAALFQKLMANGFKLAEKEAKTTLGRLEQMQNEIGDLKERIGKRLVPAFQWFISLVKDTITIFDFLAEKWDKAFPYGVIMRMRTELIKFMGSLGKVVTLIPGMADKWLKIQRDIINETRRMQAEIIAEKEKTKAKEDEINNSLIQSQVSLTEKTNEETEKRKEKLAEEAQNKLDNYIFSQEELDNLKAQAFEKKVAQDVSEELAEKLHQARLRKIKMDNFKSTISFLTSAAQSSNKTLAAIGKAAATTEATIDTYKAANKALASAPPPFNFALMAAVIATGLANVARIQGIKLAEGGIVMPRTGGTSAIIGEAGKAEAVIPLDDERTKEKLSDVFGGETVININAGVIVADDYSIEQFAEKIDEKLFSLRKNYRSVQE